MTQGRQDLFGRLLDAVARPFRRSIPFSHRDFGLEEARVVSRLLASRRGRERLVSSVTGFIDHNSGHAPSRSVIRKMRAALDAAASLDPDLPGLDGARASVDAWEVMSA
jgi:hypothetical protein